MELYISDLLWTFLSLICLKLEWLITCLTVGWCITFVSESTHSFEMLNFPKSCKNCKNLLEILNDAWNVCHLNGLSPLWVNPCTFKVLYFITLCQNFRNLEEIWMMLELREFTWTCMISQHLVRIEKTFKEFSMMLDMFDTWKVGILNDRADAESCVCWGFLNFALYYTKLLYLRVCMRVIDTKSKCSPLCTLGNSNEF